MKKDLMPGELRIYSVMLIILLIIIFPISILSCHLTKFNVFQYLWNVVRYNNANFNTGYQYIRQEKLKKLLNN